MLQPWFTETNSLRIYWCVKSLLVRNVLVIKSAECVINSDFFILFNVLVDINVSLFHYTFSYIRYKNYQYGTSVTVVRQIFSMPDWTWQGHQCPWPRQPLGVWMPHWTHQKIPYWNSTLQDNDVLNPNNCWGRMPAM